MGDGDGKPDLSADQTAELAKRLRDLDRRLGVRRSEDKARAPTEPEQDGRGYAMALRLGADFVAGVLLGAALGWGFDRLFGTGPWGLIVFVLLGFAAGTMTALRSAGLMKPGPAGPDDKFGRKG